MKLIRLQNPAFASWPATGGFAGLSEVIDRLFESPFGSVASPLRAAGGWNPAFDVYENADRFTIAAELPGLKKNDIHISLQDGRLTVSGERKVEERLETAEVYRSERFFGQFRRSFALPSGVNAEKVSAKFQDGVLTITIPKSESTKPKQIDVSVN